MNELETTGADHFGIDSSRQGRIAGLDGPDNLHTNSPVGDIGSGEEEPDDDGAECVERRGGDVGKKINKRSFDRLESIFEIAITDTQLHFLNLVQDPEDGDESRNEIEDRDEEQVGIVFDKKEGENGGEGFSDDEADGDDMHTLDAAKEKVEQED